MAEIKQIIAKKPRKGLSIRISQNDLDGIKEMAKIYANGNVSDWVKYAALNHKPKKAELI